MRQAIVAGKFYPADSTALKKELDNCFSDIVIDAKSGIKGTIVPHAGYVYSGRVAAHSYAVLPPADTYIILGPNHTGYGSPIALSTDSWLTPLGKVEVDKELKEGIAGSIIDQDELAHRFEHSIEVQIPFLQYRFKHDFKIFPICMGMQDEEIAIEVGTEIARAIMDTGRKAVIIASSDFTHYQPARVAESNDKYLIKSILNMNVHEFYNRLYEKDISACGFGPIAATITAARELGASRADLLKYATSGEVTGDNSGVVGYASLTLE
ncbi:MEMO1 family protein [uncultured Methanomethylovorans sp.]|uniref:MEMO1 family protein n=1 Tax=uncultured Methanomethylovorans sp. TaxID=183759 RepID=UPI002AA7D1D7|nr:MEMO1 family protein [uncultured Methanomethylovorans sp.]